MDLIKNNKKMIVWILVVLLFVFIFLIFFGYYRFNTLVEKDKEQLFNHTGNTEKLVLAEDLEHLPPLMKDYLIKVGVVGKCKDCHAILKQNGQIRQKPNKGWKSFTSKQFITSEPLGFIWAARAFPVFVKDKSVLGEGEMNISFLALGPIQVEHTAKTSQSALGRCLGELALYPVGFLSNQIQWQELDGNSVWAKVSQNGTKAEGVFYFDENGLIDRFVSQRYRGEEKEKFTGKVTNYESKSGLLVPTVLKAIWNLDDGDFEYFRCTIIDYRID